MVNFSCSPDSIIEAVFEIRFEHNEEPEIFLGKADERILSTFGFTRSRSPQGDIPHSLRMADSRFRYESTFQYSDDANEQVISTGGQIVSYRVRGEGKYPGGNKFSDECGKLVDILYQLTDDGLTIVRVGHRIINALTSEKHHLSSISDLNLNISVNEQDIADDFIIAYQRAHNESHRSLVRIGTPKFAGKSEFFPESFIALVDIDISRPDNYPIKSAEELKEWQREARLIKNSVFKEVVGDNLLKKLGG